MSTEQEIKQHVMSMAVADIELLLNIIGDLSHLGYKACMCKLRGNSHQQCSNKLQIPKHQVQYYWEKCKEKSYDLALIKIFNIK